MDNQKITPVIVQASDGRGTRYRVEGNVLEFTFSNVGGLKVQISTGNGGYVELSQGDSMTFQNSRNMVMNQEFSFYFVPDATVTTNEKNLVVIEYRTEC